MKALILNSGLGSRMGVLTSDQPKCMTEVSARETILSRQLGQIASAGISDVIITVGYHRNVLIEYCEGLGFPLNYTFVDNPLYDSTNYIYSIYCAREYLDDDIVLMHGDLVFENEVFDMLLKTTHSCMTISSTLPLPEKDFKAVIRNNAVIKVGVDLFDNAVAAQALYKLNKADWEKWLSSIINYCESGNTNVYAENALNSLDGAANILALDIRNMLCSEIDNVSDLAVVSAKLKEVENRIVYICFSTDIIHGGHIELIRKASKLGKVVVGILSDEAVKTYKRAPILPAYERKLLFSGLAGVFKAVDQAELSYSSILESLHPDIVVHGDDWKNGFQKPVRDEVIEILASYGGRLVEYPYVVNENYREIDGIDNNKL